MKMFCTFIALLSVLFVLKSAMGNPELSYTALAPVTNPEIHKRHISSLSMDEIYGLYKTSVSGGPHMYRVYEIAGILGKKMGLKGKTLKNLKLAALVHDLNDTTYRSDDEKKQLREDAKKLLIDHIGINKSIPASKLKEILMERHLAYSPDDMTQNINTLIECVLNNAEILDEDIRETFRKLMLIELSHERFALESLTRHGITINPFIEWLILHHDLYLDFKEPSILHEIDRVSSDFLIDKKEMVLALDILIIADVFENFINRQRLVRMNRPDKNGSLKTALDTVKGKCDLTGIQNAEKILPALTSLLLEKDAGLVKVIVTAREIENIPYEEIKEVTDDLIPVCA